MSTKSLGARVLAMAAGVLLLIPTLPVQAAPQAMHSVRTGTDLVLVDGVLSGQLLSANGQAVAGAVVTVSRNGQEVARTVTLTDGSYQIKGLASGNHTVSLAGSQFPVRLWSKVAAPPAAKNQLTVTQTAVRGQFLDGDGNLIVTNIVIGSVAATALGLAIHEHLEHEDLEDDIQDLQDQIDSLVSP